MRIIAGRAKSLPLKTIPGSATRPTTDRTKETLFNMLMPIIPGARFLDLFAGSGGIGLEAVSRGAKKAVFVEQSREAAACIRENIRFTKAEAESTLLMMDVMTALRRLNEEGASFDLIFMDPPYRMEHEKRVLSALKDMSLCGEETLIVVEASRNTDFSYLDELGYELVKKKEYKTNMHVFVKKKGNE